MDQLKKRLGSGSYGTVWSTKHPHSGKQVALKQIKDVFTFPKKAKMIFRELKILNHLNHDNVISVIDVMLPSSPDLFHEVCIATELMFIDLQRLNKSKHALAAKDIQLIFYQIVRGLRYIHSARIIHRDIKPGNILVNRNWTVKICDFGMARREMHEGDRRRMTLDVSTYFFRAPELYFQAKQYTTAVDMWGAGCVLARLLNKDFTFATGAVRNPRAHVREIVHLLGTPSPEEIGYASANVKRQLSKWTHQEPKMHTLRDISPFATEEVVDLLSKLLRYDPSSRLKATEVLKHSFLDRGRKMYHSCLCRCCRTSPSGLRLHVMNLEPAASQDFDDKWESEIISVEVAKQEMFKYLNEQKRIQKNFSL